MENNLQPTGTATSATNNPQQNVQGSLQPQPDSNLQPTSNQSVNSINQLDQGSVAIPVSAIPNTTTTTQPSTTTATTRPVILYGFGALVCAALLAWIIYDWLRPSKSKEVVEAAPEPLAEKVPVKQTTKPPKSKKKKAAKKRKKR